MYSIKKGSLYNFSKQQIVDCSGSYDNFGCMGGTMENVFEYVTENGI